MTNILLLKLAVLLTNSLPYGAYESYAGGGGNWASNYCWTATLTYAVPSAGVYVVQYTADIDGGHLFPGGSYGMPWTDLNAGAGAVYGPGPGQMTNNFGYYTNTAHSTNRITFPVPPCARRFFRLRRVGP